MIWEGQLTSEGKLREDKQVQTVEIIEIRFVEEVIGAAEIVVDVAQLCSELQASDFHGAGLPGRGK
jgi:hypothetical protein